MCRFICYSVSNRFFSEKKTEEGTDPPNKGDLFFKTYTKEEVRSVLAGLAQNGYREESKALVRRYADGGSLTDVPPERYADLIREAEEIGRGD